MNNDIKHSEYGIMSTVVSLSSVVALVIYFTKVYGWASGIDLMYSFALFPVSLILSTIGLFQKKKKKLFCYTGIGLYLVVFLISLLIWQLLY